MNGALIFNRLQACALLECTEIWLPKPIANRRSDVVNGPASSLCQDCFVDGKAIGSCRVPGWITTSAVDCALGGNPHFAGNEYLAATFADFGFWAVALSQEQLEELANQK